MRETMTYAWREINRRKKLYVGNILGYLTAVCFLAITLLLTGISSETSSEELEHTGAQFIGFTYATGQESIGLYFRNEQDGFFVYNYPVVPFPLEVIQQIQTSAHVRHAAPLLTYSLTADSQSQRPWTLTGFEPDDMESVRMMSCSATNIIRGRLLEPGDQGVVLLEQTFSDAEGFRHNDTLVLGGLPFVIKGILSPGTRPVKADIYLPYEAAMQVLNTQLKEPARNLINAALVDGKNSLTNRMAQRDVLEILGLNSSVIGYGCFSPAGAAWGITRLGMQLVGIIVFVSIMIFIMASQYQLIWERRSELGILKAIGWSNSEVCRVITVESFYQSLIGALAGILLAIGLLIFLPLNSWLGIHQEISWLQNARAFMQIGIFTVFFGSLAGWLSANLSILRKPALILRSL